MGRTVTETIDYADGSQLVAVRPLWAWRGHRARVTTRRARRALWGSLGGAAGLLGSAATVLATIGSVVGTILLALGGLAVGAVGAVVGHAARDWIDDYGGPMGPIE